MGRIRSIRPELPHSATLGACSRDARYLFVLLFTLADDEGRLRGHERLLASLLFPFDLDAGDLVGGWLTELSAQRSVIRYTVDGVDLLAIPGWHRHQRIDKPTPSRLPAPPDQPVAASGDEESRTASERSASPREPSTNGREGSAGDGTGVGVEEGGGEDQFELFWFAFDYKAARPAAEKAWRRIAPDAALAAVIAAKAAAYAAATPDKAFRKHPATWLNSRGWEDELPQPRSSNTRNGRATSASHIPNMPTGTPSCECAECVDHRAKSPIAPGQLGSPARRGTA